MLGLILQIKELQLCSGAGGFAPSAGDGAACNPNCCFGELEQSTATRTGVGRSYFEVCHILFIYFILKSGVFLSFREENLSNGLYRKMH